MAVTASVMQTVRTHDHDRRSRWDGVGYVPLTFLIKAGQSTFHPPRFPCPYLKKMESQGITIAWSDKYVIRLLWNYPSWWYYTGQTSGVKVFRQSVPKSFINQPNWDHWYMSWPHLCHLRNIQSFHFDFSFQIHNIFILTNPYTGPRVTIFVHFFIARRVWSDDKHQGVFEVFVGDSSWSGAISPTEPRRFLGSGHRFGNRGSKAIGALGIRPHTCFGSKNPWRLSPSSNGGSQVSKSWKFFLLSETVTPPESSNDIHWIK